MTYAIPNFTIQPQMFKYLKESFSPAQPKPKTPLPVIRRPEDNLPPEERYALKPDRVYRVFPGDKKESDVQGPCGSCGGQFDGPAQSHCPHCHQDRPAFMRDVTDEPYHALPAEKEGEAPVINADELIPTFGGAEVRLGKRSSAIFAHGDYVSVDEKSELEGVAGNTVNLGWEVEVNHVVAKNKLYLGGRSSCQGGLVAKEVRCGSECEIGSIIIPDKGLLTLGYATSVDTIFLGPGAVITALDSCNIEIDRLVILGPDCQIALGPNCTINTIETNSRFQLKTGDNFTNETHKRLKGDYNLAEIISFEIAAALGQR